MTRMKSTFTALAIALMTFAGAAHAADSCDAQASTKKLSGAAKTSFLKKCNADMPGTASMSPAPMADSCESRAGEKKLAGAAKTSFLKKCNADSASATCDTQAATKKLAGAAKNSFVKKCVADAAK